MQKQALSFETRSIPQLFKETAERSGSRVLYRYRGEAGTFQAVSYRKFLDGLGLVAAGLTSLGFKGKKMLAISDNCPELSQVILASMSLGGAGCGKGKRLSCRGTAAYPADHPAGFSLPAERSQLP